MKRITSKLTGALVVLLLFAAAVTTAGAQEKPAIDAGQHNDLAARGEAIANADPLAVELRNRAPEGPSRRGFDIGMAAWEGNTAPGPGKKAIHDSLSRAEQIGFRSAAAFSLDRNRNADLAATGAAIAAADPIVARTRTVETDVLYWLGFDIATGIFGDPALGALSNTATGPGSLGIRDALSLAGQRGFNAAVTLHLSRRLPSPAAAGRTSGAAALDLNSLYTQVAKNPNATAALILTRVPDVVGVNYWDAERALRQAGFEPTSTFQDEPDPSVLYGHVRATVPAAGMLAADGKVELQIPRAASRLGIGALSLSDLERRAGFDLDEGRYEEMLRGADIVLRKYENEPRIEPSNGSTYYAGGGVYIEPSDGAVLASLNDVRHIRGYGLGSYFYYGECERALKRKRVARVEISRPND